MIRNGAPTFSIIIPAYEAAQHIESAVETVKQQRNISGVEIIIVDDGSTDGIKTVCDNIKNANILYVRQENQGPAAARNTGIQRSSGELLACLDADDDWPQNRLSLLFQALQADPKLHAVYGRLKRVSSDGKQLQTVDSTTDTQGSYHLGTALFRRGVFDLVGLFDPALRYSEDLDWYMRAIEQGAQFSYINEHVLNYRAHEESTTHGKTCQDLNMHRVIHRALQRRRKKAAES